MRNPHVSYYYQSRLRSGRGAKIWAEQVEPALKAGNTEYQTYFSGKAGEVRQLAAQITAEHAAEPDHTLIRSWGVTAR